MKICYLDFALLAAASSLASAAPINCPAAHEDLEQAICSHPELLARDRAISDRLDALKTQCPESKKLLMEGQKFWLRERSDCRNLEGVFEKPDRLPACISDRMDQRLQKLNNIGAGCDVTPLIASYRFVDVDYIQRFSDRYIGKTVSVAGWMDVASCKLAGAAPTLAHVVGKDNNRDRFRVKFSAMPAAEREFLCDKTPLAHWRGVIQHDSVGNYLFLTDVLGQKLPNS
jgi:uncharacterized protein